MKKESSNCKTVDTVRERERAILLLNENSIKNPKTIIAVLLVCLILLNLIIGLWFNNKLNKITKEFNNKIQTQSIKESSNEKISTEAKYKYTPLLDCQAKYDSKKQYFNYTGNEKVFINAIKDKNGIRLVKINNELVYNPVSIAQYGLDQYSNYIEYGEEKYYKEALKQAEYLLKAQNKENGNFYYDFDFKVGGTNDTLFAPWNSAMAQGQAISLFSRIYNKTKDKKWIKACDLALKPLTVNVKDGGLKTKLFGYTYYEEYPTNPSSYTLNGFMFTLIGLYDFYSITGNKLSKQLYLDGMKTLEFCLPLYDYYKISLYHLGEIKDKELEEFYIERYHSIHIIQLKTLRQEYPREIFDYYIDKWESYVK